MYLYFCRLEKGKRRVLQGPSRLELQGLETAFLERGSRNIHQCAGKLGPPDCQPIRFLTLVGANGEYHRHSVAVWITQSACYDCESDIRRMVVAVNCLTVTKLNEDVFLKIIKKITSLHVNALHLPCRSEFV
ncbi:hypothetical protein TcasGA2_TC032109 [Tribolium castaneum]|uniref:Uncharacterized protein n=1 Tax=Tribolium castaneum TaxID=7070 RepID=A0A139WMU0_TRICA|nr:hypothetical protein TcasGA2_TC032109 [Tribolium castaneum]